MNSQQQPQHQVVGKKGQLNFNDHVPVDIQAPDQNIVVKPSKNAKQPNFERFGGAAPFMHHHFPPEDMNMDDPNEYPGY